MNANELNQVEDILKGGQGAGFALHFLFIDIASGVCLTSDCDR